MAKQKKKAPVKKKSVISRHEALKVKQKSDRYSREGVKGKKKYTKIQKDLRSAERNTKSQSKRSALGSLARSGLYGAGGQVAGAIARGLQKPKEKLTPARRKLADAVRKQAKATKGKTYAQYKSTKKKSTKKKK